MRGVFESLTRPLRELAWKIDEKVVWPLVDAVDELQYRFQGDGTPAISAPMPRWRRYGPELLVAGVLTVVAFLARRHGLPTDGLWLDDSVPAAALNASPSQLFVAGDRDPGFILSLMGWHHLTGGSDAGLAYPALIAGTLSPALLFLALRGCGYDRAISALLGAALVAAQVDIVYSGRVRTYTIDALIVLGLALILPRLVRIRWRWQMGVAWAAAGIAMVFFSVFLVIPVAVASAIVVLRPASDLRVRTAAIAAQAGASIAIFLAEGRTYDNGAIEDQYRQTWDSFVPFHPNPLRFGGEVLLHLRRLAQMFPAPGGPVWFATVCAVAALIGLATIAWRGRQAIRARYLLLILFAAFVGGVLGKFPFGPKQANPLSDGGRLSLWLLAVLAIGLAVVLQGLRGLVADRRALRIGFDTAAYLATAAILVSAGPALRYPFPGAKSAANFVDSHLGRRDALLIPLYSNWSFAAESSFDSKAEATPESSIGFQPEWSDPRIHYVDSLVGAPQITGAVGDTSRVFVYHSEHPFNTGEAEDRTTLTSTLRSLGLKQRTVTFGDASVDIWRRTAGRSKPKPASARHQNKPTPAAGRHLTNLRLSDFPRGWGRIPPLPSSATAILACLHVTGAAPPSVVSFRTKTLLFVVSQVTHWPSAAGAQSAYAALSGPHATGCLESVSRSLSRTTTLPVSATAKEVPPPPTRGDPAVAYRETVRTAVGTIPVSHGTVVFFTHGRTGVLISSLAVAEHRFPSNLLSSLVATMADRVNAATP